MQFSAEYELDNVIGYILRGEYSHPEVVWDSEIGERHNRAGDREAMALRRGAGMEDSDLGLYLNDFYDISRSGGASSRERSKKKTKSKLGDCGDVGEGMTSGDGRRRRRGRKQKKLMRDEKRSKKGEEKKGEVEGEKTGPVMGDVSPPSRRRTPPRGVKEKIMALEANATATAGASNRRRGEKDRTRVRSPDKEGTVPMAAAASTTTTETTAAMGLPTPVRVEKEAVSPFAKIKVIVNEHRYDITDDRNSSMKNNARGGGLRSGREGGNDPVANLIINRPSGGGGRSTKKKQEAGISLQLKAAHARNCLHLQIYLPNRTLMRVTVEEDCTVRDTVRAALRHHQQRPSRDGKERNGGVGSTSAVTAAAIPSGAEGGDKAGRRDLILHDHPEWYEMRLHEYNGMPDEDFPALDLSRKIKHFGTGGGHEYCLCEVQGAVPASCTSCSCEYCTGSAASSDPSSSSSSSSPFSSTSSSSPSKVRGKIPPSSSTITIHLPNATSLDIHARRGMLISDLLPLVAKNLQNSRGMFFAEQTEFHVSEADRKRKKLLMTLVDSQVEVNSLGVRQLFLVRKRFADAPQTERGSAEIDAVAWGRAYPVDVAIGGSGSQGGGEGRERGRREGSIYKRLLGLGSGKAKGVNAGGDGVHTALSDPRRGMGAKRGGGAARATNGILSGLAAFTGGAGKEMDERGDARPDLDSFLLNEYTATMYQEWQVVKTNKWGKPQKRIMGIDHTKIYNRKVGQQQRHSNVRRPDRLISDILGVNLTDRHDYRGFKICFKDRSATGGIDVHYEASTPRNAAEIVAKIRYIRSMQR